MSSTPCHSHQKVNVEVKMKSFLIFPQKPTVSKVVGGRRENRLKHNISNNLLLAILCVTSEHLNFTINKYV